MKLPAAPLEPVLGRDEELDALDQLLADVQRLPAALVLGGEIGIGKTTVWRAALTGPAAGRYRILATQAAAAESELAFTVLADLLEDVIDELLGELSAPERHGLEVALLRKEPGPDWLHPRAIAGGLLSALRFLARERPLLIAIDDAQWVDSPSQRALEFAVRRLSANDPIALLVTLRGLADEELPLGIGTIHAHNLKRLWLGPLSVGPLHALLHSHLGISFPRPVLRRLVQQSGGNPFFALELARALSRRRAPVEPGDPLPVPRTLQHLVADRLALLSATTRQALLVAGLASEPTVALLTSALGDDAWIRLRPAAEAGAIELDGDRIRFAHPVVASVALTYADLGLRRAFHRRLAELVLDPIDRARHVAFGAAVPDAAVAATLDTAAAFALARGAPEVAGELSERAARLTPNGDDDYARRRKARAAEYYLDAGAMTQARDLLKEALASAPGGRQRAGLLLQLAREKFYEDGWRSAVLPLREAEAEAADDEALLEEIQRRLAWGHFMDCDLRQARAHAAAAASLAGRIDLPVVLAQAEALLALIDFMSGRGLDRGVLDRAVAGELQAGRLLIIDRPSWLLALMLYWQDELEEARAVLDRLRKEADERGDYASAPYILNYCARIDLRLGAWKNAERLAREALDLALQTGQEGEAVFTLSTCALIDAHFGRVVEAREQVKRGLASVDRTGMKPAQFEFLATEAFVELSTGDAAAAHRILGPLAGSVAAAGYAEPSVFRFHGDAIETLVTLGRLEEAESMLTDWERHTTSVGGEWAMATCRRCRGRLLAARGHIAASLETLETELGREERLSYPFELARTMLTLGSVQRRAKRRADARRSLDLARLSFERLGARLWAERAQEEHARIGGRMSEGERLTPTESEVARLVADGSTNKEVAAALFVTVKTVEANLTRVYAKLGVRSRTQLARHFRDRRGTDLQF
jgi:DNA-binding CsgD family transcriptional regulator